MAVTVTDQPTKYLVVKGLGLLISEEDVSSLFRQYASVVGLTIIRDKNSGISRGIAVIEFATIEFSTYALQCANTGDGIKIAGNTLTVAYAADNASLQQLKSQSATSAVVGAGVAGAGTNGMTQAMMNQQYVTNGIGAGAYSVYHEQQQQQQQHQHHYHHSHLNAFSSNAASGGRGPYHLSKWPPKFEDSGDSYIFHQPSGLKWSNSFL